MSDNFIRLTVGWSDPDLLEVYCAVRFQDWGGGENVYVTRDELLKFAGFVEAVASGDGDAALTMGESELGFAEVRISEYSRARRLSVAVRIGRGTRVGPAPDFAARRIELAAPLERGQLSAFAAGLRSMVAAERGSVTLALPISWP